MNKNFKAIFFLLTVFMTLNLNVSVLKAQQSTSVGSKTNSFFDDSPVYDLKINELYVQGEVINAGKVDFSKLKTHSLIVKETLAVKGQKPLFVGAYKYSGYSLSEILDPFIVQKSNAAEFPPLIDLYVEIENQIGEKTVISWGELYYSAHQHDIILATKVMRIVPEKTKEEWTLPVNCKLVIGTDLLTMRNIDNPVKITVKTFPKNLLIEKGKFPLVSKSVKVHVNGKEIQQIDSVPYNKMLTLHTVFYGKGRGLHSTGPISGYSFKDVFSEKILLNAENLRNGLVLLGADDGYRAVFTLSELLNRNDQQFSLLIYQSSDQGKGLFRFHSGGDFFSDRAVKGLTDIWFILPE